jgi:hypothetical protein
MIRKRNATLPTLTAASRKSSFCARQSLIEAVLNVFLLTAHEHAKRYIRAHVDMNGWL